MAGLRGMGRFSVLGSCWASRRHCPGPSPVQRGPPSRAGVEGASGVPSAIWVVAVSRPLLSRALSPPLGKQAAEAGGLGSLPGGGSECRLLAAREPAPGRASASPSLASRQQTSLRRGTSVCCGELQGGLGEGRPGRRNKQWLSGLSRRLGQASLSAFPYMARLLRAGSLCALPDPARDSGAGSHLCSPAAPLPRGPS